VWGRCCGRSPATVISRESPARPDRDGAHVGAGINLVIKALAEQTGIEGITAHSLCAGPVTAAGAPGPGSHARDAGPRKARRWTPTSARQMPGGTIRYARWGCERPRSHLTAQ